MREKIQYQTLDRHYLLSIHDPQRYMCHQHSNMEDSKAQGSGLGHTAKMRSKCGSQDLNSSLASFQALFIALYFYLLRQ